MQLGQQIVGKVIPRYLGVLHLGAPWIWFYPRSRITQAALGRLAATYTWQFATSRSRHCSQLTSLVKMAGQMGHDLRELVTASHEILGTKQHQEPFTKEHGDSKRKGREILDEMML
jgi:hypothetical protein